MPTASSPAPKKAKQPPVPKQTEPIVYPEIVVVPKLAGSEKGPLTVADAKKLLRWEDEEAYGQRVPGAKFGDAYDFIDLKGRKVRCWNNSKNRPFDQSHALKLAQDILDRKWADSRNTPAGEVEPLTINGETIIITRRGRTDSGQHRLIGLCLAEQLWEEGEQSEHWRKKWPDGPPSFEALLVFGVSDNPKVTMTLDNVKPRTLADIFYTTDIFAKLDNSGRRECSRMLDAATDLLWKRTCAGASKVRKYQTHSTSMDFVERHKSLLKAVKHIFEENQERQLSVLKLSPGQCAAMLYLMAASGTIPADYLKLDPPSEKKVNLDAWDKACEFWVLLSSNTPDFDPLRKLLAKVHDPEEGCGTNDEKLALLIKAWQMFSEGHHFTEKDLALEYKDGVNGAKTLAHYPDLGGIDFGGDDNDDSSEADPTPEQMEAIKQEKRRQKEVEDEAALDRAKVRGGEEEATEPPAPKPAPPKPKNRQEPSDAPAKKTGAEAFAELKAKHPGKVLLFRAMGKAGPEGSYMAYAEDAQKVFELTGIPTEINPHNGVRACNIRKEKLAEVLGKLHDAGLKIATAQRVGTDDVLVKDGPPAVSPPKPKNKK